MGCQCRGVMAPQQQSPGPASPGDTTTGGLEGTTRRGFWARIVGFAGGVGAIAAAVAAVLGLFSPENPQGPTSAEFREETARLCDSFLRAEASLKQMQGAPRVKRFKAITK